RCRELDRTLPLLGHLDLCHGVLWSSAARTIPGMGRTEGEADDQGDPHQAHDDWGERHEQCGDLVAHLCDRVAYARCVGDSEQQGRHDSQLVGAFTRSETGLWPPVTVGSLPSQRWSLTNSR